MGKRASSAKQREMTDETLLKEAASALEERLGVMGYLRYLRLTQGGRDNMQDLRRSWETTSIDEVLLATEGAGRRAPRIRKAR